MCNTLNAILCNIARILGMMANTHNSLSTDKQQPQSNTCFLGLKDSRLFKFLLKTLA